MLSKEYILECLDKYCTFNEDLSCGTFEDHIVEPLEAAGCFEDWTYDSGATKGVLIFGELDYVIKIPFYAEYDEYEEDYDEETDEYYVTYEGGTRDYCFEGVQVEGFIHDNEWDYCETESYRYIVAERNGMGEHFAKTEYIGSVQEWPIYAQVRACMFCSQDSMSTRSKKNYSKEELQKAESIRDAYHRYDLHEEWIMDFIAYYGEDELKAFFAFCDEWNIEDLHSGNIGYICGVPCLVDYSSFNC
jgi:hypothetical protein